MKLTNYSLLASTNAINDFFSFDETDVEICYLPYAHTFEQAMLGLVLLKGMRIGFFQGNPTKLVEDCGVLRPTFFPSVPRLWNKIYGTIQGRMSAATGCKKWMLDKGIASKTAGIEAENPVFRSGCYDKLIFSKIAALLGGQVKVMVTASAPIDKGVLQFLKICFCAPMLEGYGLSETSGGATATHFADPVVGHVGGPGQCVTIRLKDVPEMNYLSSDLPYPRGEVCMKGPLVFDGYFKRPEKTAEAFDEQGWFRSGDVGMLYPNGSIKIIDRSKNIFKLSQGEYIAPEKLENLFVMCDFVAQSMIYGDSLKNCVVGIVVPEEAAVKKWAAKNGKSDNMTELCKDEDLKKFILDDMVRITMANQCSSLEKPKALFLSNDPFTCENEILTPTFKLKRNVGRDVYQGQIDAMYKELAKRGL